MEQYFVELGVSKYDHIIKESELDSFQMENNDCTDLWGFYYPSSSV